MNIILQTEWLCSISLVHSINVFLLENISMSHSVLKHIHMNERVDGFIHYMEFGGFFYMQRVNSSVVNRYLMETIEYNVKKRFGTPIRIMSGFYTSSSIGGRYLTLVCAEL